MSITVPPGAPAAAASPQRFGRADRLPLAALLLALLLPLLLHALALRSNGQAGRAGDQALQAQQAVAELAGLQSALADAELPDAALSPPVRPRADAHLAALRLLLSADAEQYSRLVALGPLLSARLDARPDVRPDVRPDARPDASNPASDPRRRAAAATGAVDAARQHARIRDALGALRSAAQAQATAQQQRARSSGHWAAGFTLAAAGTAVALLVGGWLLLRRRSRQLAAALAQHNGDAQRAQQAAQALQTLLDMAPDAVCHIDSEGRIGRANLACTRWWARPASALQGLPLTELILPADQRKTAQMLLAAAAPGSNPSTWTARCKRPDGSVLALAWTAASAAGVGTATAAADGGDGDGVWCIAQDLSPLTQAATLLAEKTEALQQAQARAAQADARATAANGVKDALLANTGPALRAPAEAILALAGMLQNGVAGTLATEQQRQVAMLRGHAQQLLRSVNNMLDITRLQAGTLPLLHEAFDLLESIQTVAATARVQASDKGLKLDLEMAPELGYARGDAARFEQILHNLLDNAVRATAAGGIRLQAAPQPDGSLRISVSDTGPGLDAATAERLFKPFGKSDGNGAGMGLGLGLGLTLSQGLAQRMGGSIGVSSVVGKGSTFVLTLPGDVIAQQ